MSDFNIEFVPVFKFQPRHPGTRMPMDGALLLHGKDSPAFKTTYAAQRKRHLEELTRSRGSYVVTDEQREAEALDLLVACTAGWENASYKGQSEFSPALVRALYVEQAWLREQVDEAIGDRANFLAPSKTS